VHKLSGAKKQFPINQLTISLIQKAGLRGWLCSLIAWFLLSTCHAGIAADWQGWRGLHCQGRSETGEVPLLWSETANVLWKTEISGEGYSSPVIARDRVYVTTSYPGVWAPQKKLDYGMVGLAVFLAGMVSALGLRRSGVSDSSVRRPLKAPLFVAISTLFLPAIMFGSGSLDYQRSEVRGWLASAVLLTLSLVMAASYLPAKSRWTIPLMALGAAASAIFIIVGRSRNLGPFCHSFDLRALIVLLASTSPVFGTGLVIWLNSHGHLPRSSSGNERCTAFAAWRDLILDGLLTVVILLCVAGLLLAVVRSSGYLAYHFRQTNLKPTWGWWSVCAVTAGGMIPVLLSKNVHFRACLGSAASPDMFRVTTLALGIAVFGTTNWLSSDYLPTTATRAIICLDRLSGCRQWTCEAFSSPLETLHHNNSPATPTPVADTERVYARFGPTSLCCADRSGRRLWTNCALPYLSDDGVGASPSLFNNLLIVVADQSKGAYVAAVENTTGRLLWKNQRAGNPAFNCVARTPILQSLDGTPAVIVWGFDDVTAYELPSGRELWSYRNPALTQHCMVSSLVSDTNALYLATPRFTMALGLRGVSKKPEQIWVRTTVGCNCSSPVLANGLLFMVSDSGLASCLETANGKFVWQHRLPGRYFSSPIVAGDRVYFCNENSLTTVVAAGREFHQLAQNDLVGRTVASMAPVDGQLFIRTAHHLYCLQSPPRQETAANTRLQR
jgi:outer membrane protein assembly factor BamB